MYGLLNSIITSDLQYKLESSFGYLRSFKNANIAHINKNLLIDIGTHMWGLIMVALCNRADHNIFIL